MFWICYQIFFLSWIIKNAAMDSGSKSLLALSKLGNKLERFTSIMDTLFSDTAEITKLIHDINETFSKEKQMENPNKTVDGLLPAKLLKAFQEEKKFNKDTWTKTAKSIQELNENSLSLKQDIAVTGERNEANKRHFDMKFKKTAKSLLTFEEKLNDIQEHLSYSAEYIQREMANVRQSIKDIAGSVREMEKRQSLLEACQGSWIASYKFKSCFRLVNRHRTWEQAVNFCKKLDSTLIQFENKEKLQAVYDMYIAEDLDWGSEYFSGFWAGGSDITHEGQWIWNQSGQPIENFVHWLPGQPSNHGGNEDCLSVMINDKLLHWNDNPCTTSLPFICEKII